MKRIKIKTILILTFSMIMFLCKNVTVLASQVQAPLTTPSVNKTSQPSEQQQPISSPRASREDIKAYFDGETTINFNIDVPFTNIDISDLPKADIPIAQEFACNFVDEHFMKKNSENPKKASKMVVICDEAHRMFKYEGARSYLED